MSKVILAISLIYFLFFLALCVITQFVNIKLSNRSFRCLIYLFSVSCCIIAFFSTDGNTDASGWDLNRYYDDINSLRLHGLKFAFEHSLYKESYITVLLFFFVSRLSNNGWLPAISTFISLLVLNRILIYEKEEKKAKDSSVLLYLLLFFAVMTFSSFLGVRWILASSICTYATFLEKKSKILPVFFYIIAYFIHYGIILFLVIRCISIIKKRYVQFLISIIPILAILYGERIFAKTSLMFLYEKLRTYEEISASDNRVFFVRIILLVIFVTIEFLYYKKRDNRFILNQNTIIASIASIGVYHLFTRMIGMYYYQAHEEIIEIFEDKRKKIYKIIFYIIIVGMYAYQFVFMKTYWRFNI